MRRMVAKVVGFELTGTDPRDCEGVSVSRRSKHPCYDGSPVKRPRCRSRARPWYALAALGMAVFVGCGDGGAVKQVGVSGTAATLSAGAYWKEVSVTPRFNSRALAYDSARKRVWHFEVDSQLNQSRMWDWDGTAWTLRLVTGTPGSSAPGPGSTNMFSAMTYDSLRDRVVLFGHGGASETWLWDGASWALSNGLPTPDPNLCPPNCTPKFPAPRDGEAIAYDSGRGYTVLFGGAAAFTLGALNDTWEWNGSYWTERTVSGPVPPGGFGVRLAYDAARAKTVLLTAGSTWEWDGATWQQRSPAGAAPLAGTMTYDARLEAVVLFGGDAGQKQVWQWDGQSWTERPSAAAPPSVEEITYDSARDKVVLFGSAQTWEWDGLNWAARVRVPPAQTVRAMAYDRARQEVVLFGGNVMWTWKGSIWQPKPIAGSGPSSSPVMAYDAFRERVVLFDGGTWEWDGTTLEQRMPSGDSPLTGRAMTYDGARGTILLLAAAADGFGETWTWDGTTWTHLSTLSRPPLSSVALAYDSARAEAVLFTSPGRRAPQASQTWEWDGADWRQRLVGSPLNQTNPGMAYDVVRGKVVLFGLGTWDWAGGNSEDWTQFNGVGVPDARESTAMAYDSIRHTMVMFGGSNLLLGLPPYGDTWELRSGWMACSSSAQCTTGTCVDGACCDTTEPSCGVCRACNVPGSEGVCAPRTGSCDDGNACTRVDTCQAGQCVGSEAVSCAPQGECRLAGSCDPTTGVCSSPPAADGTPCVGICPTPPPTAGQCLGSACMEGECRTNLCLGVSCTATDTCHQPGICDPTTGACSNPEVADGTACDDGDRRTRVDTCQAGTCVGTDQHHPPSHLWYWWHRIFHWRH